MTNNMNRFIPRVSVMIIGVLLASCASTEPDGDRTPRRVSELDARQGGASIRLARAINDARTIQLYREGDETSLPIIALKSRDRLTLEFDILASDGRPLSVYFYHADKDWRRDLNPAEYLETFHRDDILDYSASRLTEVPYVHYRYTFPNQSIQFVISGNYIIRVTEQGREDLVVFEKPFFVTEQASEVQLALDNMILSGFSSPGVQPYALFSPAPGTEANVFAYSVCFARNGAFDKSKCTDQPSLMKQPALEYYLRPSSVFQPLAADYFLDLSTLQHSNRIERIERSVSPFQVSLEPDLGRLGASGLGPVLNGQPVITDAVRDVPDPDLSAQYVDVIFQFVPEGARKYSADVFVSGAFNQWRPDETYRLQWNAEYGRYERAILIKQGQYDYRYVTTSDAINSRLQRGIPRQGNLYTAFVYYDDISLQTDRLISIGGTQWNY